MSDLSNVEVGDWIWTIQGGWVKVEGIDSSTYAITTKECTYTMDGLRRVYDAYHSAFTEPPSCFPAESKPCEFKKGQRVITKRTDGTEARRYFSHEKNGTFYCFDGGKDEWSSQGDVFGWDNCKAWEDREE